MDSGLKQRLIGAAVLVALAVIFLPMLVQGPAPDSGVSDVPLQMPDAPQGQYETRDLPLVTPGTAPDGGALGMDTATPSTNSDRLPTVDTGSAAPTVSEATPLGDNHPAEATPLPVQAPPQAASAGEMFPPPIAGGDYAVHFGSFASSAGAQTVVNQLRSSQLPGYREPFTLNGKPAYRVRIGPYATRADAEAARLRAAHVRDDVGARVVALDADSTPAAAPSVAAVPAATVPTQAPKTDTAKPAEAPKPIVTPAATPAASSVGFAVQLGAFSKMSDADALRDRARAAGFSAFSEQVNTDKGALTRVRLGPVSSRADADQLKAQAKAKLGVDGIVRPHP